MHYRRLLDFSKRNKRRADLVAQHLENSQEWVVVSVCLLIAIDSFLKADIK
jgi:hypothetical protein